MTRYATLFLACSLLACTHTQARSGVDTDVRNDIPGQLGDTVADTTLDTGQDAALDAQPDGDVASQACTLAAELAAMEPNALKCGHVPLGEDPSPVYTCAVQAQVAGKPFTASFEERGIDSDLALGLVRTSAGSVFVLRYDGNPMGGGGASSPVVDAYRCVKPTAAFRYGFPRFGCEDQFSAGRLCSKVFAAPDATSGPDPIPPSPAQTVEVHVWPAIHGSSVWPLPPVPWTGFQIQKGWGPCPPGSICTESWQVAPDGAVQHTQDGKVSTYALSAPKRLAVDDAVGSPLFLVDVPCPQPPTDVGISFVVSAGGTSTQADVTGCVLGAPNALHTLVHGWVTQP
jgi:hypothetical protein